MRRRIMKIGMLVLVLAAGTGVWAWTNGWFDKGVHDASASTLETSPGTTGTLEEALVLAKAAQAKINAMQGYRCIYLRDEVISNELQQNHLRLTVAHQPFSVCMEWIEPALKKGRKAIYVEGKNGNKMVVKQLVVKMNLDPSESIKRKESRHTILEAGLQNMVNRFVKAWEEEREKNETHVTYSDSEVQVIVQGKPKTYACRCVDCSHPPETQDKYAFGRVKLFFDKATGLPVRMEGFDWPTAAIKEGRLLEKYTYIDVQSDPAPQAADFQ
jgi:hypothetical protein